MATLGCSSALPSGLSPGDARGALGMGRPKGVPVLPLGGTGVAWGCHSDGFAPRVLPAALPAASRLCLGEVRVVVQSFLFYILLCHAAPAAEPPEIAANPGRFHFKVSILGSPALLSHELRERGVRSSGQCHAGILPPARAASEGTGWARPGRAALRGPGWLGMR